MSYLWVVKFHKKIKNPAKFMQNLAGFLPLPTIPPDRGASVRI
jgi:hypothetical protein